jgi:ribosomal protein S18 acetylase RimI-like enzyme
MRVGKQDNALPLANATQFRARCDVLVAEQAGHLVGVAATYHDLPLANLTFAASAHVVGELLHALAARTARLRSGPVIALLPAERRDQLRRHAQVLGVEVKYQMVVEPEVLRGASEHRPRRLTAADLLDMQELARVASLSTWHAGALALGPAFGCHADGRLVAMAGTHFATPEVIEIGFIATHPDYWRRGYASACTSALAQAAFALAPRVFLMVLEHNAPAVATYKKLGFRLLERLYLARFSLSTDT